MFTLPDLSYAYNALEPYIDERTMQIHHDKHHAAYVKNLNDTLMGQDALLSLPIEQLIGDLSRVSESIRTKVRNNGGGHANHSMFWSVMGPSSGASIPTGKVAEAINAAFGNLEQFKEKFSSVALAHFGSGWVWLVSEDGKLSIVDTANQDSPLMDPPAKTGGKKPILVLDVWEHAYYLKYQNMRADYIKAWWNVVNWTEVEKRYSAGNS